VGRDPQALLSPPPLPTVDGTSVRPTHLQPDSILGVYLRQLLLDCNVSPFEGLSSLFSTVQAYAQAAAADPEAAAAVAAAAARPSVQQVQQCLQVGHKPRSRNGCGTVK
jgi:hypothetical protein